jgi:hypothetical protein
MASDNWRDKAPYRSEFQSSDDEAHIYKASCFCGRVKYDVQGSPLDAKLCHCQDCQVLHGAPFEWVSIFAQDKVRFKRLSLDHLQFYNTKLDRCWTSTNANDRILPAKVRCSHCGTPIADEGRNMWLAYATMFRFREGEVPSAFRHSCHIFYAKRCINLMDDKKKWTGEKDTSEEWTGNEAM